jgi:hypothetical protein
MLRVYHVSQILFTNDLDDADPCVHIVYLLGFFNLCIVTPLIFMFELAIFCASMLINNVHIDCILYASLLCFLHV